MPFNRILLVIADEAQRELYQSSLQEEGYHVQVASDGDEALDLFRIEGQDVVAAESELPGMAGLEVLATIRAMNESCGLLLVAGSSENVASAAPRLQMLHADVLKRPFNVITLLCAVEKCLEALKAREAAVLEDQPASPDIKLRELEIKLEDYRSKVRDLTREVGQREGQEEKLENVRALVRDKEKELSTLREDVARARESQERLQADYTRRTDLYQKTIDGLMNESKHLLEDLEKKVIQHTKQLELLSTGSQAVSSSYEKKLVEVATELELLRGERDRLASEGERNRTGTEDLERLCQEKLTERETQWRTERQGLEASLVERDAALKELERRADEANGRIKELELERDEQAKELQEKLTQAQSELPAERKKVQTLLDYQQMIVRSLFSGFLSVDVGEKITLVNQLLGDLLGLPIGKLIGERLSAIKALAPAVRMYKDAMERNAEVDAQPLELLRADGSRLPVTVRCRKVKFGQKFVCLLLFNKVERVEVPVERVVERVVEKLVEVPVEKIVERIVEKPAPDLDANPIYAFGANVAGDVVELKEQLTSLRTRIEKSYALAPQASALRESINLALNDVSDLLESVRSITEKAEKIMAR